MKAFLTIWVNIFGIFIATLIYSVVQMLTMANYRYTILPAMFAAFFGLITYGMMFWLMLIIALGVLDLILKVSNKRNLLRKLLLEWLIISIPFIYWTIKYHEWLFAIAIIAFLFAQLVREKYIKKITG